MKGISEIVAMELTVESGPSRGTTVVVHARQMLIGRDTDCTLCLPDDATVSRRHASLSWEQGQWILRDLGSKNGTFLARETGPHPLAGGHPVAPGERFLVGSALVSLNRAAAPESTPLQLRIVLQDTLLHFELRSAAAVVDRIEVPYRVPEVAALHRALLGTVAAEQGGAIARSDDAFIAAGHQLAAALLPGPLIGRLQDADGALSLMLDPALVGIAWEAMCLGGQPLGLLRPVSRQVLLTGTQRPTVPPGRRVLVVANPTPDLAHSHMAAEVLLHELTEDYDLPQVQYLAGPRATTSRVCEALMASDVAIYLGHAAHHPTAPQQSGWRLADGILDAGRFTTLAKVPALVIAAACESARETPATEGFTLLSDGAGVAAALLLAGGSQYIGTLWRVPVVSGSAFGAVLLGAFLSGHSAAEAMLAAQRHLKEVLNAPMYVRAGYVQYGTPDWRLAH